MRQSPGARMKPVLAFAAALSMGLPSAWALDPQRAPSQYVVKTWGATSLGSNTVYSIAQTEDGALWLGTSGGLLRYDGARFTLAGAPAVSGFPDGGVSALAVGDHGYLYLGTTSGFLLRRTAAGPYERLLQRARPGPILALQPRRDGSLWMAKDAENPVRWRNGTLTAFKEAATLTARAMAEGPDGTLWIGTREGLLREKDGVFMRHPAIEDAVQALGFDEAGALWVGTPHGLHRLEGDRTERFRSGHGLAHDDVTAILEDGDGNLWIGTTRGLSRRRAGRFESFTSRHGLSDDDVRCLFEDREGTLWVGTGDGLTALRDGSFITYGGFEGLPDARTTAVTGARDGAVWIGTASGEVVRLEGRRTRTFTLPAATGRQSVDVLYEARDASLWVATENGRLFRIADGRVADRTPRRGTPRERVVCLFEDDDGVLAFVLGRGIARPGPEVYARVPGKRPTLGFVHAVHRDERGFWMGTTHGLALYTPEQTTRWQDGLPEHRVRWLAGDAEDRGLWLATAGGLAYFKDGAFQSVGAAQGLPENYLRVVLDDGLGHLWIGGAASVFRVDKSDVRAVFAGRAARLAPVVFDTSDGLRTTESQLHNSPGFRAHDGRLWFATAKGVSVIDPRQVSTDHPAPAVRIESLTVDGRSGAVEYGPGRGEAVIEYAAASLSDRIRFRHRLEGLDADWVAAGEERRVYYSSLQPGRYRFLVTASNRHGVWNGSPVAVAFTIRPPFHRRPLFYVLCAAVLAGLVVAGHRYRVRQMQDRFAAVIGERTRIARELHDTLAQGVAGIRLQVETGLGTLAQDPEAARAHFHLAGAMARSSLAEVRRSIWVLRAQTSKGNDGLVATLSEGLRQLTAGTSIAAAVDIAGEAKVLPPALEHNLLRILHELVLNAVRHSGATRLSVAVRFEGDAVRVRVEDDGRGFDAEGHLARTQAEHFGLLGVVERAQALGGALAIHSRPGQGTRVDCRLPYE
jgi:signal transduction histidine kinase/ligand-binding sensor domain-containing protein